MSQPGLNNQLVRKLAVLAKNIQSPKKNLRKLQIETSEKFYKICISYKYMEKKICSMPSQASATANKIDIFWTNI